MGFYFSYRIIWCVYIVSAYTSEATSTTCTKKPKIHISHDDYNELFVGVASEPFSVNRLQCIMTCVKRGEEVRMAAYDDAEQLCCCVDRDVESVEEGLGTREVYLVDFHRGEL